MTPDKHFDVIALLTQVANTPYGLAVKTNHPQGFRRIVYKTMAEQSFLRCKILQKDPTTYYLVPPTAMKPETAMPEAITFSDIGDEL